MFTKLVSWLIVIGLINFSIGCAVQRTIRLSDKSFDTENKIISVTLNDGQNIIFDELGGQYISKTQTINGFQITAVQADHTNKKLVAIKTQDIRSVTTSHISVGQTVGVGIAVGMIAFLAFLLYLDASGGIMGNGVW